MDLASRTSCIFSKLKIAWKSFAVFDVCLDSKNRRGGCSGSGSSSSSNNNNNSDSDNNNNSSGRECPLKSHHVPFWKVFTTKKGLNHWPEQLAPGADPRLAAATATVRETDVDLLPSARPKFFWHFLLRPCWHLFPSSSSPWWLWPPPWALTPSLPSNDPLRAPPPSSFDKCLFLRHLSFVPKLSL